MKNLKGIISLKLLVAVMLFASSCKKELQVKPTISGVETDIATLNIGDKLTLAPNITNTKGNSYIWLVNGKETASGQLNYTFQATEPGIFEVIFKVTNKGGTEQQSYKLTVEKPIVISLTNELKVSMSNVLEITPAITGPDRKDYEYEWSIGDLVIGKKLNLSFISPEAGTYELTLRATAGKQSVSAKCTIAVKEEQYIKNAYTVLEYAPSPGKNHNWSIIGSADNWKYGDEYPLAYNDFLAKASAIRKINTNAALFLGSWGGSVTFKFDHTVANVSGKTDLEMNAFHSARDLPAVYVAYDRNKNGMPDEDEWYELKNDDYGLEDIPEYEMVFTYNKTETDAKRIYSYFNWKDNQPSLASGEILTNKTFTSSMTSAGAFSNRGFFPGLTVTDNSTKQTAILDGWKSSFSRKGKRISRNITGAAPFFQKLNIDIDMAVNKKGETIQLPGIDFVRVQKVVYPFQQDLSTGNVMTDYNMEEGRMLQVGSILDKHLKN
ncbi:PKD-like domain-containing protein [Pedobacter caeni]|uniref:PKD-like domain-containing protein n=1 Tax=Pedobacter caeni TaxID=288992 RepID=A0A1M4VGV1_9SPHI|nr:PKD-like domain-containing protein [Pedobacter caeni]SHE68045.1 PKD-like domain-containing protein [Pedobacter caeni]